MNSPSLDRCTGNILHSDTLQQVASNLFQMPFKWQCTIWCCVEHLLVWLCRSANCATPTSWLLSSMPLSLIRCSLASSPCCTWTAQLSCTGCKLCSVLPDSVLVRLSDVLDLNAVHHGLAHWAALRTAAPDGHHSSRLAVCPAQSRMGMCVPAAGQTPAASAAAAGCAAAYVAAASAALCGTLPLATAPRVPRPPQPSRRPAQCSTPTPHLQVRRRDLSMHFQIIQSLLTCHT